MVLIQLVKLTFAKISLQRFLFIEFFSGFLWKMLRQAAEQRVPMRSASAEPPGDVVSLVSMVLLDWETILGYNKIQE